MLTYCSALTVGTLLVVGAAREEPFHQVPAGTTSLPCAHELIFEPFAGLTLIPLQVAGSPPLDFVLDSGANQSSLSDPSLAAALGLEVAEAGTAATDVGPRLDRRGAG